MRNIMTDKTIRVILIFMLVSSLLIITDDAVVAQIVSDGPSAMVTKNLGIASRGMRNVAGATTDVWTLNGYAYTGTFNSPCGGDPEAGVWVWDVHNHNKVNFMGVIPSPVGSRSNDVKVAAMNSGNILVHSNQSCAGGPGGFEIYNVDDPSTPVLLASVRINEINPISNALFGGITDVGVRNVFLFNQGENDYMAAVAETAFDNFQIYDITDPTNPAMVSAWGAEEIFDPGVGNLTNPGDTTQVSRVLSASLWLLDGFGASQNRFLQDITISADGTYAYLANWDAGLILIDISDVANPQPISVALDPTSEDGEVNSNSVWPSEDGMIVIEGEEDLAPFDATFSITSGPAAGNYPAAEGAITVPIASLPGAVMSGPTVYVGLACPGDTVPTAPASGNIALIQRGTCFFSDKIINAEAAGYSGVVVFNDALRGDALVTMGGTPTNLPGVFVGHSTGLAIAGVTNATSLVIGASGEGVSASTVPNGWGGLRIWDYTDPANPVLASTFNTVCSANPVDTSCNPAGTYSAHNVFVETTGNRVMAYTSWSSDGILILDITVPYNPVETARFLNNSTNDGLQNDFWGVYKTTNSPWIYGSDRNRGLYVFKEFGSGSTKQGQN